MADFHHYIFCYWVINYFALWYSSDLGEYIEFYLLNLFYKHEMLVYLLLQGLWHLMNQGDLSLY